MDLQIWREEERECVWKREKAREWEESVWKYNFVNSYSCYYVLKFIHLIKYIEQYKAHTLGPSFLFFVFPFETWYICYHENNNGINFIVTHHFPFMSRFIFPNINYMNKLSLYFCSRLHMIFYFYLRGQWAWILVLQWQV